jgi:hypothetical protein
MKFIEISKGIIKKGYIGKRPKLKPWRKAKDEEEINIGRV